MNTLLNIITIEEFRKGDINLHAVTHGNEGGWHLDEILCAIQHAKKIGVTQYNLICTRDKEFIEEAKNMDNVLVYDVGMGELDHHQPTAKLREDGVKFASASLVKDSLSLQVSIAFQKLLDENDYVDNGVDVNCPDFEIVFDLIKKANSHFEETCYDANSHMNKVFEILQVLNFSEESIENTIVSIRENEKYKKYITLRNQEYQDSLKRISVAIQNANVYENTLIFDKYFPAIELVDSGFDSLIFLGGNGQWALQGIPKSVQEWNIPLKGFSTDFAGLRDEELVAKSGMQGGIFCLPFIAFFDSKENAMKSISKMI